MVFLHLAKRNVLRKRERSMLTLVGMMLAVACFVTLLSLGEGINYRVRGEFQARRVSLYVLPAPLLGMTLGNISGGGNFTELMPYNLKNELISIPGVERVAGISRQQIRVKNYSLTLWGVDMDDFEQFLPDFKVGNGRLPVYRYEIMMGAGLAKKLGVSLGKSVTIGSEKFKLVGIGDAGGTFQDYSCFVPLSFMMEMQRTKKVQEFWLQTGNTIVAKEAEKNIMEKYPHLGVKTGNEYAQTANEVVFYAWLMQFCIALIGVLIALTATMNTMLISTYERMKEFGTLRAIGLSRAMIFLMIMTESLLLSLGGGILGIIMGIMGARLIDDAVCYLFQVAFPIARLTPDLMLNAVLLSVGVGFLGSVIPGLVVVRKNIIQSLRWD